MKKATVLFCTLLIVGFFVSTADAGRVRLGEQATTLEAKLQTRAAAQLAVRDRGQAIVAPNNLRGETPSSSFAPCPGVDCQTPYLFGFSTSDAGMGYQVADDQFAPAPGTVTSLCFYGIYYDFNTGTPCGGNPPTQAEDDFRVRFLGDSGGVPDVGTIVAQFNDLQCARAIDDFIGWAGFNQYIYTCTLPSGVDVNACESTWIEIANDLSWYPGSPYPGCAWLWTYSQVEHGNHAYQTTYNTPYGPGDLAGSRDYAFCTDVNQTTLAACTAPCTTAHQIDIEIQTDSWGNETTWELFDLNDGSVVCSGGPYPDNTLNTEQCCVDGNCYEFCIYDSWGDGIYAPGGYTVYFDGVQHCSTMGSGWYGTVDCSCTDIGGCVQDPNLGACCFDNVGAPYNCADGMYEADCDAIEGNTSFAGAGTNCATAGCMYQACASGPGSFN